MVTASAGVRAANEVVKRANAAAAAVVRRLKNILAGFSVGR